MRLIDANFLLHAYNPRSAQHDASRCWLEATVSGAEMVRFAWVTVSAFLRIDTNPRVCERSLSVEEAARAVASWLDQPAVGMLDPGERHWDILKRLLSESQVKGPLVMDAALAALVIEHGATLETTDRDFARFTGLKWRNLIAGA